MRKTTVEVLEMLKEMFPAFSTQILEAIHAYECPFEHFCQKEAEYRLDESGFECEDREVLEAVIAKRLFSSDCYLDNDIAVSVTEEEIQNYKSENAIKQRTSLYTIYAPAPLTTETIRAFSELEALGKFFKIHPTMKYRDLALMEDNKNNSRCAWEKCYEETYRHEWIRSVTNLQNPETENVYVIKFTSRDKKFKCYLEDCISEEEALGCFLSRHSDISFVYITEISRLE